MGLLFNCNTIITKSVVLEFMGGIGLNRWECIQVNHHDNVGKTIEEFENRGWNLHTYSAAQLRGSEINHYLLFKRNK